jgi:hypothetical protein
MRDPTPARLRSGATDLVIKELIEITIQYLCERELLELLDAINASFARQPTTAEELSRELAISQRISELRLRPPARKRGRPPQRRNRHLQIAGAVLMLVEDYGLKPTRSHASRRRRDPSACSIVAAALAQRHEYLGDYLGECRAERLSERTVEEIWNQHRLSPLIIHQGATDYARNHRYRISSRIIR